MFEITPHRRTWTRRDLLEKAAAACPSSTRKEAEAVVRSALVEMTDSLVRGEPVSLRAFGLFSVRTKRERPGRDFETGDAMLIAARRVVTFSPSPVLIGKMGLSRSKSEGRQADTNTVSICRMPPMPNARHHRQMAKETIVVRSSPDWDVPEPWEVVKVASDGAEVVVDRTSTQDEAASSAAEEKRSA